MATEWNRPGTPPARRHAGRRCGANQEQASNPDPLHRNDGSDYRGRCGVRRLTETTLLRWRSTLLRLLSGLSGDFRRLFVFDGVHGTARDESTWSNQSGRQCGCRRSRLGNDRAPSVRRSGRHFDRWRPVLGKPRSPAASLSSTALHAAVLGTERSGFRQTRDRAARAGGRCEPPYRREVLDLLKAARVSGTRITLATGADSIHANQVAPVPGLFSEVIASGDGVEAFRVATKPRF